MRSLCLLLLTCHIVMAQDDPVVKYSRQIPKAEFISVVPDGQGNVFVLGRSSDPTFPVPRTAVQRVLATGSCGGSVCNDVIIAKFRASDGEMIAATFLGGTGQDVPVAIALDSSGNVYVTGTTTGGFPVTEGAIQPRMPGAAPQGFVTKLNSTLTGAFFSTYLGGAASTRPAAIAADFQGNAYVTGNTDARDFPTTPNAFKPAGGSGMIFVTKLNSSATGFMASSLLGAGTPAAIAADINGNIIVAGTTSAADFPTSADAPQKQIARTGSSDLFITRFNGLASQPLFSTYLGGAGVDQATDMIVDPAGNLYLSGTTFSSTFPGTTEPLAEVGVGFITRLSNTAVAWTRPVRANGLTSVSALQFDAAGNIAAIGATSATHFPTTSNAYHRCVPADFKGRTSFFLRLGASDGALQYSTLLHENGNISRWATALPVGELLTISLLPSFFENPANLVRRYGFSDVSATRVDCVVSAGSYRASGLVPGMAVTLFGSGLGPAEGVVAGLDSAGKIPTSLGGARVLFGDVPAPLLYARQDQVNAIVPFSVRGPGSTQVRVEYGGAIPTSTALPVRTADPGIFRIGPTEFGAILNEDNSVNTPENAAARGSIVTFWATGLGLFTGAYQDGSVIGENATALALPVRVAFGGVEGQVLYAGASPAMVAGIAQLNVRIPSSARVASRVPIAITVGDVVVSDSAYLSIR